MMKRIDFTLQVFIQLVPALAVAFMGALLMQRDAELADLRQSIASGDACRKRESVLGFIKASMVGDRT